MNFPGRFLVNKHQGRARVEEEISRTAEVRMGATFRLPHVGRFYRLNLFIK